MFINTFEKICSFRNTTKTVSFIVYRFAVGGDRTIKELNNK
jgi:hypothetical protein